MPQIDFYLSIEEKCKVIELVINNKGIVIPSLHYDNPEYITINSVDEYHSFAKDNSLLFILHESYEKYPLAFDNFDKDNFVKFFIKQRTGGPTIDFFSSGLINTNYIGPGFISYYPYFYINGSNTKFAPPIELINFYKDLVKYIKKNTIPFNMQKRKYLIGKSLIERVLANELNLIDISKEDILLQLNKLKAIH